MTNRRSVVAALGGAAVALVGVGVSDVVRYLNRAPAPSVEPKNRALGALTVDPSWVKSGTPNFRATEIVRSPIDDSLTGIWACDGPTTFEWTFGQDETVYLIEGRIEVEYQQRRFTLQPGDTATFHAGTKSVWHVPKYARKVFTLSEPGRWVRWWRRLVHHT